MPRPYLRIATSTLVAITSMVGCATPPTTTADPRGTPAAVPAVLEAGDYPFNPPMPLKATLYRLKALSNPAHQILVQPRASAIHLQGYAGIASAKVELLRQDTLNPANLAVIAQTLGASIANTFLFPAGVDINAPGATPWDGWTPFIRGGDVIRVTGSDGSIDTSVVDNITCGPATQVGSNVVVHGNATNSAGGQFPLGLLQHRLLTVSGALFANGKRFLATGQDGVLVYDVNPVRPGDWTATFANLNAADLALALAPTAISEANGFVNPLAPNEQTMCRLPSPIGPMPGGPAMATNAAQSASRLIIDASNINTDLVISGQAQPNATQVTVFVNGGAPHGVTITPGTSQQPWQAVIPAAELFALPDGPITINNNVTLPTGTIAGDALSTVTRSLGGLNVTASPASGSFLAPQLVTLSATLPGQLFFTTDGTTPTTASTLFTTPIPVGATSTLKVLYVNNAGVQFPVLTDNYVINLPPAPPVIVPPVAPPVIPPVVGPPAPPVVPPVVGPPAPPVVPPIVVPAPPPVVPPVLPAGTFVPTPAPFALPSASGQTPLALRNGQTVTLLVTNVPKAAIFFTVDGGPPTAASTLFSSPIVFTKGLHSLKFMATANGKTSAVATKVYRQK